MAQKLTLGKDFMMHTEKGNYPLGLLELQLVESLFITNPGRFDYVCSSSDENTLRSNEVDAHAAEMCYKTNADFYFLQNTTVGTTGQGQHAHGLVTINYYRMKK
ncbi:MAG: hypothetical protein V1725_01955 [archaeon]